MDLTELIENLTAGYQSDEVVQLSATQLRARYQISEESAPDWSSLHALASDPLCGAFLTDHINSDWSLEQFLTRARPMLWTACAEEGGPPDAVRPLCIAMAQQAFNNEYVFAESDDEIAAIDQATAALDDAIASGDAALVERLFLRRGLYRAPATLGRFADLAARLAPGFRSDLRGLVRRCVDEPLEERRLHALVPRFGVTTENRSVQRHYENSPYPRWLRLPKPQPAIDDRIRRLAGDPSWSRSTSGRLQVLVAGSGTGRHAIQIARDNPGAEVTAVDLSAAAIAHGLRKAAESAIENLSFIQGDLLELAALDRRFDHIECSGVLHHVVDHQRAWGVLAGVLGAGGTLHAGVYSKVARLMIETIRRSLAERSLAGSDADVRRVRAQLADTALGRLMRGGPLGDLATMSMTRDLLFHPQEYHYTLAEIEALTTSNGFRLLGAVRPQQVRDSYRQRTGAALPPVRTLAEWREIEWAYAGTQAMFEGWFQRS